MKCIQKALNHSKDRSKASFSDHHAVGRMLQEAHLHSIIEPYLEKGRNRLYGPKETLSMFVTQAIHPDRSCQNIVNQAALLDPARSVNTGGYCQARGRLDSGMIQKLIQSVARHNEEKLSDAWRWQKRDVYLVDGTTLVLSDTPANQKTYPQTSALPEGIGFPICRLVGVVSLGSGSLIDADISPYHGKGASEQHLLRRMLHHFKAGDVVLADAFYSTYFLIAHMIQHGIDIVFVQHGARSRSTDFTKGEQLGKNDHLIVLTKPKQKPDWMEQEAYDAAAQSLTIREFKAAGKTLITTMTCAKTHPKKALGDLYKKRWHIEVDLRHIKSTMGLKMLSCQTPDMAIKELWVYFLAYNMIRSLMLASALYACVLPRTLSFKHTLQLMLTYQYDRLNIETLYSIIAKISVGNRPGRIEPRVIKRRHNDYPLMKKPRHVLREEIKKNGHPKKLK
jgi:hypothetical protein